MVKFQRQFSLIIAVFCFVVPIAPLAEKGLSFVTHINIWLPWLLGVIILWTYWLPVRIASIIQIVLTCGTGVLSMFFTYDNAYLILMGVMFLNLLRVYGYLNKNRGIKITTLFGITITLWLIAAIIQTHGKSIYTPIQFILFMTMSSLVYYITYKHDRDKCMDDISKQKIELESQKKELKKEIEKLTQRRNKESQILDKVEMVNEKTIRVLTAIERGHG